MVYYGLNFQITVMIIWDYPKRLKLSSHCLIGLVRVILM